jgi:hypothetical protein
MRVLLLIVAALVVATTSAYAQADEKKALEEKRRAEQDQAYKASIQRIPAKQAPVDPWGAAREVPSADTGTVQKTKKPPAAKPPQ